MRAILKTNKVALERIITDWIEEDAKFYSKSFGFRQMELIKICKGFPSEATSKSFADMEIMPITANCGFTSFGINGVWLRSSGSWIATDIDNQILIVSGSRHSIRELLPEWFRATVTNWEYLES